jgi:hypothetical protein
VARTYRITINCTHVIGMKFAPTLHYQTDVPTAGSEPDPDDVANGVWGVIATDIRNAASDWVTFDDLVAGEEVIPPDIGVSGVKILNVPGLLVHGDAKIPTGASPLLNLHTGTRSRSARGWTHPPGPTASTQLNGQQWSSAYITLLNNLAAKLDDSFDLGTVFPTHVNPVVYSRKRHVAGESPYTFRVTGATVNPEVKWLRSRMTTP